MLHGLLEGRYTEVSMTHLTTPPLAKARSSTICGWWRIAGRAALAITLAWLCAVTTRAVFMMRETSDDSIIVTFSIAPPDGKWPILSVVNKSWPPSFGFGKLRCRTVFYFQSSGPLASTVRELKSRTLFLYGLAAACLLYASCLQR